MAPVLSNSSTRNLSSSNDPQSPPFLEWQQSIPLRELVVVRPIANRYSNNASHYQDPTLRRNYQQEASNTRLRNILQEALAMFDDEESIFSWDE